jgi:membrane protein DedA with SNARE-associated domain
MFCCMQDIFFVTSVEHFSYLAIFIFAGFSGYLIPIPEEIILLITGYMAWAGIIHITPAIIVVVIAFIIGDNILFRLTLKNNKHVSKLIHEVLSLKIVAKRRPFLEEHIGVTIFLSRFIPFLRFAGPVFSGYVKAREKTFMLFNTLAIVIYAPFVVWVGYFFNDYFGQILFEIGKIKHILFVLVLIIAGLLISRMIDYFFNKDNQTE